MNRGLKRGINAFLTRFGRFSPIVSVLLLILNTALMLGATLKWRVSDEWYYWLLFALALGLAVLVVVASFLYSDVLKMHLTETDESLHVNKYATFAFTPKEAILYRTFTVPQMRFQADFYERQGMAAQAEALRAQAGALERWMELGYIPQGEFPRDLSIYYPRGDIQREAGFVRVAHGPAATHEGG